MVEPSSDPRPQGGVSCGVVALALIAGLGLLIVILSLAVPSLLAVGTASNERSSSASLKTVTTAEADFRSNDRDGNLVNDFWTADVFALYGMIPVPAGSSTLPPDSDDASGIIKLVEPSVAGADGLSRSSLYGNVTFPSSIINGCPKAGYVYRALAFDGAEPLWTDTDGSFPYGAVHHRTRFAFAAMPDNLSVGVLMYIVNADNTIWKLRLPGGYSMQFDPIHDTTDSSSSVSGTGHSAFDFGDPGTGLFPADPASAGCSKMD